MFFSFFTFFINRIGKKY